jgi:hypothetical protein
MSETNTFGGKNKRSNYIPLSETELEVIARLVDSKDLKVIIQGWGVFESPKVIYGDKNLHIPLKIDFTRPTEAPVDVYFFDMELRSGSGITLFKKRMSTEYGGQPLKVMAGLSLEMVWDISIRNLDPTLVRAVKPGAQGLTSRLQDKLTLDFTDTGNMNLNRDQSNLARAIRAGENRVRSEDLKKIQEVSKKTTI